MKKKITGLTLVLWVVFPLSFSAVIFAAQDTHLHQQDETKKHVMADAHQHEEHQHDEHQHEEHQHEKKDERDHGDVHTHEPQTQKDARADGEHAHEHAEADNKYSGHMQADGEHAHEHTEADNKHGGHMQAGSEHAHGHDEVETDAHGHEHGHEDATQVKLTLKQLAMADIVVKPVYAQKGVTQKLTVPGEVVNDLYHSTVVSIRVDSNVLSRHVVLGQHVKKGQILAILYSMEVATAQNQLKVSYSEWDRVKKLGRKTVGEKRYIEAKAAFERDRALLLSYGFNQQLLKQFLQNKNKYKMGEYPAIAPHEGVILNDSFQSGQFLSKGSNLVTIVDERKIWVEALLPPDWGHKIPVGSKARVEVGKHVFTAQVIHDSHAIDEVTRTRKIRLQVDNQRHILHAGQFATVYLQIIFDEPVILIPETALMRSTDGDWTVFVEKQSGIFEQKEVEILQTINGMQRVNGLVSGSRIAIAGAFFLASELAKGGFDPHNH